MDTLEKQAAATADMIQKPSTVTLWTGASSG